MLPKYKMPSEISTETRILTNDVYLVAFLLTQKCSLSEVVKNNRRRISFVIEGEKAASLKRAYKRGPVYVNVRFFRDKLLTIRRLMDGKQRSVCYGPNTTARVRTAQA